MKEERQKLEEAIAAQEGLRGTVDDAIIDATIAALHDKLDALKDHDPELRRKQVTVLFTDTVESTPIVQHLDPEDARDIFESVLKHMADRVRAHGGRVTGFMGDGFKSVFGADQAREDDPERAVRAGLEMIAAAEALSKEFIQSWGIPEIKVRVGIHTGLVALGGITEAGDTMMGSTVHLASRLESAAPPGGLLISHETYRHIRGVFDVVEMEPIIAKGFDEPVIVYRVLRVKPRPFRTYMRGVEGIETRMIGRQTELKFLQDAMTASIQEGEGHHITIVGEAGVGKSRLLYEFQNWIDLLTARIYLFKGRAWQEAQSTPFSLLRDVIAFRFEILEDDPPDLVIEKLENGFSQIFGSHEHGHMRAHFIGQMLGFGFQTSPYLTESLDDPQQLRNRGVKYLSEYFENLSRQHPVAIFLEDIHWSDDSSLDVVNALGRLTQHIPLLVICLSRPGLFEHRPYWGEGLEYHSRLELKPLSKSESRKLVTEIFQRSEFVPSKLRELLVAGSEGNPFYIEELVKMLIDNGVIITGADLWHVELDMLGKVQVPSTLTGVLQARLDSLPSREKLTLQQASVVGRTFWDSTVNYIGSELTEEKVSEKQAVSDSLGDLRGKEMIYRREESIFKDAREFVFKHAILRDVTYESVLKKVRSKYHSLVAEWLIQQSGERGGEYAGLIAEHLLLAGKQETASVYFMSAAEMALRGYANKEAEQFFTKALNLSTTPSDKISILTGLGKSFSHQSRYDDAAEVWEQAITLCRQIGDSDHVYRLYAYLARNAWYSGDPQKGLKTALKGLEFNQGKQRGPGLTLLLHEAARAYYFNGQNDLAETFARQAIQMADELGQNDAKADALSTLGVLPDLPLDERRAALEQAISLAEENNLLLTGNRAYNNLGSLHYFFLGNLNTALDCYQKAADIAKQIAITHQEIYNLVNVITVLTDIGKLKEAQEKFYQLEPLQHQIPDPESVNLWMYKANMVLAGQSGSWEKARSLCLKGLAEAREHGDLSFKYFFASYLIFLYLELDRFKNPQRLENTREPILEAIDLADRGMGGRVWVRSFKLSVLIRQGDLVGAKSLIKEIEEITARQEFSPEYYFTLYSQAELAEAENNFDQAVSHYQELLDYYHESDFRWEWARTALDLGGCLNKRRQPSDIARSRDLFKRAAELFSDIGAPGYSQVAKELLRDIS